MAEDFKCELADVESLEDYFGNDDPDPAVCRPCSLKPLAEMYLGTLEEAKEEALATELVRSYETGDVLTIARTMDKIKLGVGEQIRSTLNNLDCEVQSFRDMQDANIKQDAEILIEGETNAKLS